MPRAEPREVHWRTAVWGAGAPSAHWERAGASGGLARVARTWGRFSGRATMRNACSLQKAAPTERGKVLGS